MADINLTPEQVDEIVIKYIEKHSPGIVVDSRVFLDLLKNSLSLNVADKRRVIDSVPDLSQFQFDELRRVFLEEREKFKELAAEHPDDIKKIVTKQRREWLIIWDLYRAETKKGERASEDTQKIDDIKKSLGL